MFKMGNFQKFKMGNFTEYSIREPCCFGTDGTDFGTEAHLHKPLYYYYFFLSFYLLFQVFQVFQFT